MTFYIISYDIPDDKRRTEVAKILEGFGDRRQYSVFECHLTDKQMERLWKKLDKAIEPTQDSILVYTICKACVKKARSLGLGVPILEEKGYYIV
jgi:CRISPR-associated protein Cas2